MLKILYNLLALLLMIPFSGYAAELKPFTTDGCSSFPDGTISQQSLWVSCCIAHDLAYWKGGTYEQRLKVDKELERCVANVGEPEIARIMLTGVRIGGSPHINTSFRWGYGWPFPRGYKALDASEKEVVKQKLDMLKIMINSISRQLNQSEY